MFCLHVVQSNKHPKQASHSSEDVYLHYKKVKKAFVRLSVYQNEASSLWSAKKEGKTNYRIVPFAVLRPHDG